MNQLDEKINKLNTLSDKKLNFTYQVFTGYDKYIVFVNNTLMSSGTLEESLQVLDAVEKILLAL